MSAEEAQTMSKSARKRANQKARAAAAAEEAAPPAPEPKAAARKAAAKPAAEPKAKAEGKAKAAPKEAPKAEAKAKGKAKAAPKEEPKPEPKQAAAKPKAQGKQQAKAKAKSAPKEEPVEEVKPEKKEVPDFVYELDDGKGGDWAVSSGKSKKQDKRQQVLTERKAAVAEAQKVGAIAARSNQYIPGLAPVEVQVQQAKGKAQAKAKSVADVSISVAAATDKSAAPAAAPAADSACTATIKIPEKKIGIVVGPKGATVNMLKEKTGVKTVDIAGDVCTLVGSAEAVQQAEAAVKQLIDRGFCTLQYDDYDEEGVTLHPSIFPDIIGKKGENIIKIKTLAKCEVNIPPTPEGASRLAKKYKVTLAGSKQAVTLGKEILTSINMYGHHPLIHEGVEHKELEVEEWKYRYLIGTKGSEMKHIQNSFKVQVKIPRDFSANKNVVVTGETHNLERAVRYIEKVLYEAEVPKGRGANEQAIDDGGDDGEVEDWMKPYMYKRR